MAFILEPRNRIVIPRWRTFERGAANSEIIILKPNQVSAINALPFLEDKLTDWSNSRNVSNAVEVVNAAYSLGILEEAQEAAQFLQSLNRKFPSSFQSILNQVLGFEQFRATESLEFDFKNFFSIAGRQIHETRLRLKENPNNPLLWTVLARHHAVFGNVEKAKKSIDVALTLTQYSNTYVQRIASRFYYHLGEIDKALYLVRKSRNYEVDPWLISTDIAYSTKLGRFNKNMTLGMKMIESNKFSNRDLTELASSIGTVQLQNGSMKQARKAFDVSLKEPNENSFAQVEFVSNTIQIIPESELANYLTSLPNAFEARAHEFDSARKYDEAFKDGCRWLLDQPFSKRAALFTQHLAIAKLEEYDKGIEIGKFALHSNPRSVEILNNLAFAYSKKRKFKEARIALEKMKSLHPNDYYRTFLLATEGLLKMREGNIDDGKRLYDLAINHALDNKFPHLKDLAIYNYLLEYISTTGEVDFTYVAKLDKNSPLHAELAKRSKQT